MARPTKTTGRKLLNMVRDGFGQGHRNDYRPFLKNTREAISSIGTQSVGKVLYGINRACDFESRQEKKIARALQWLGAVDVREQFPIWPWPHRHPLLGAHGAERLILPDAPGLLEIAEEAAIPHGLWPGTTIPYVATIDFMVTVHTRQIPRLVALACKNREVVLSVDRLTRPLERLELERLYSKRIGIPHHIIDNDVFGTTLLSNLEWFMPDETVTAELVADTCFNDFFLLFKDQIFENPIDKVIEGVCASIGWPKHRALSAFRYLAWKQAIDIDMTQPVLMTYPATRGGTKIHSMLQNLLLGEVDHV